MLRFVYFQVYSNWFLAMSPGSTRHQYSEETHEDRQTKRRQIYPGSFQTSRLLFGNSAGGFLFLDQPMPPTLIRALKIGLPVEVFQVVLTPHTIGWESTGVGLPPFFYRQLTLSPKSLYSSRKNKSVCRSSYQLCYAPYKLVLLGTCSEI